MWSLDLSPVAWTLVGVVALCVILLLAVYRRRVAIVAGYPAVSEVDRATTGVDRDVAMPPVSVIVYADSDAAGLSRMLPMVLAQDYPAPFEVIVINDGKDEATADVVSRLQLDHRNLYLSFVPGDTRNLSRKKLALTIGIKAARHDVLLLTCADAVIPSSRWMSLMARHFRAASVDVVIGYAAPDFSASRGLGSRFRAFDFAASGMRYLSSAILGHPYRGTGWNLAYRRSLFFRHKGFSRTLNLRYGDDDLFVSEVSNRSNTAIELSAGSVPMIAPDDLSRFCRDVKRRRLFTASRLRVPSRGVFALCSVSVWAWLAASVAVVVLCWGNLVVAVFLLVAAVTLWTPLVMVWRRAASVLRCPSPGLLLPLLMLWRPVAEAVASIGARRARARNYTWQ